MKREPLDRNYPMIKCVVHVNKEKNYYLPFDEDYDRIKVRYDSDDYYARTVKEAVADGFRRKKK